MNKILFKFAILSLVCFSSQNASAGKILINEKELANDSLQNSMVKKPAKYFQLGKNGWTSQQKQPSAFSEIKKDRSIKCSSPSGFAANLKAAVANADYETMKLVCNKIKDEQETMPEKPYTYIPSVPTDEKDLQQ